MISLFNRLINRPDSKPLGSAYMTTNFIYEIIGFTTLPGSTTWSFIVNVKEINNPSLHIRATLTPSKDGPLTGYMLHRIELTGQFGAGQLALFMQNVVMDENWWRRVYAHALTQVP